MATIITHTHTHTHIHTGPYLRVDADRRQRGSDVHRDIVVQIEENNTHALPIGKRLVPHLAPRRLPVHRRPLLNRLDHRSVLKVVEAAKGGLADDDPLDFTVEA